MAGTREGAQKAKQTNLKKNPNFYADIGSRSWDDPNRSRLTGFAKDPQKASEAGKIGGKKTKSDYKTTQRTQEAYNFLGDKDEVQEALTEEDLDTLINILKESDPGSL